jgi:hypothetical protein
MPAFSVVCVFPVVVFERGKRGRTGIFWGRNAGISTDKTDGTDRTDRTDKKSVLSA